MFSRIFFFLFDPNDLLFSVLKSADGLRDTFQARVEGFNVVNGARWAGRA